MVYKVSKGGVRSGNTLRGLRSYRTRRYTRQACIVGRSNLKPIDVPTFLDSHIEDKLISSSLGSTDVALSLNKKKRWLLPATVGHMIKTGSFNGEKTMVSLLERHKLKRRANCVSFVCNQGRVRHVDPRQKRYFSFKLDNIDSTVSNRQKRRQNTESEKQTKPKTVKYKKVSDKSILNTVDAFTFSGSGKVADVRKMLASSKPEYRLEVFYPCPQTCSLTYNPKYTNIHMEFGEQGGMELRSEKKLFKKGKKRRMKFDYRILEMYDPEIVSSETDGSWEDDPDDFDNEAVHEAASDVRLQDIENNLKISIPGLLVNDNANDSEEVVSRVQENENVLTSLIIQAEKVRSLCGNSKPRRRRKQFNKGTDKKTFSSKGKQEKAHIVYTSEANTNLSSENEHRTTSPTSTTTNYVTLKSVKVILKSCDTTPGNLRARFGRFYAEAESEPRRFVIDVTEDVQNLVCPYRDAELSAVFTSFLVFAHDGLYDEGLDTFKVIFNSNCCPETEAFKTCIPFEETSIEEIMKRVASTVLDEKEKNLFDFNYDQSGGSATIPLMKLVNATTNVSIKTSYFVDEIRKATQTDAKQENVDFSTSLDSVVKNLDYEIFCDICYENINPTQTWDVCGTKLSKCSHIFCDDCWRSHLRSRLRDGAVKMSCPGYDCDETVGPVTMLSLLHVSEVSKFFDERSDEQADSSSNSRCCPNPSCGRVIKIDIGNSTTAKSLDVTCSCGEEFCFSCLSHPHWPATCEQADKYDEKLLTLKYLTISKDISNSNNVSPVSLSSVSSNDEEIVEIEGRICPNCSSFFERGDGCSHMSCECGFSFCWECMKEWQFPHKYCYSNPSLICKLKVRHIAIPRVFSLNPEERTKDKFNGPRQRTTLYERAVHQRHEVHDFKIEKQGKEMVKQIERVCQKDLLLKRKIMTLIGTETSDKDTVDITHLKIATHVSKFLRSCCEIKRALHHVAEFTFVLLQDTADSVDKRRALRLANDLSGYCSFIRSILETGQRQDMGAAVKRLADIQTWAKRALTVLLATVNKLKS